MSTEFSPTVTNMVAIVKNIVDGYRMGPIRALAQEPVQNSKDAHARRPVHVEYRLHRRENAATGETYAILTIADRGTSGLSGPILTPEQVRQLGGTLPDDHRWAAWEGLGFSKESKDSLGSRGQGKAGMLYNSELPHGPESGADRMMMLYDTLLPDGEYRLGVRYADPYDRVRTPFLGNEARRIVSGDYSTDDGIHIDLRLPVLKEPGTRVIVPYLSADAVESIRTGELHRWLERCWWRAIQVGELEITVIGDDENAREISVPQWWASRPWESVADGTAEHSNVRLGTGHIIKRIVLHYDSQLDEDEISGSDAQFGGIQLLRKRQWIETMSRFDDVPRDKRAGFRGFVEFDRPLDQALRGAEQSQHDSFDGRNSLVKEIKAQVGAKLAEFAERLGWKELETRRDAPNDEQDIAQHIFRFFVPDAPGKRRTGRGSNNVDSQNANDSVETWSCKLSLDYPNPKTTRVDWGETIKQVQVNIDSSVQFTKGVKVTLDAHKVGESSRTLRICSAEADISHGKALKMFGHFEVILGEAHDRQIQITEPGKWMMVASVLDAADNRVSHAQKPLFVHEDPPERPKNDYRLSIAARNQSVGDKVRIDHGEKLGIAVNVTNGTPDDATFEVNVSLEDTLLADDKTVWVGGVLPGDTPIRKLGLLSNVIIQSPSQPSNPGDESTMQLPPGKHSIRADLRLRGQPEVVSHASTVIYVEQDPPQPETWSPFKIERRAGVGPHPRWELRGDGDGGDAWTLYYPESYPVYHELAVSGRSKNGMHGGANAFIGEILVEALLEWALRPLSHGDSANLERMRGEAPRARFDENAWQDFQDKLATLESLRVAAAKPGDIEPEELALKFRECAAFMLSAFSRLS